MGNFAENIKNVLVEETYLKSLTANRHSNPSFQLFVEENDKSASLKQLKITHMREDDIFFTLDLDSSQKFKSYSAYIKASKSCSYNQRCDFVIIRFENNQWHVYFADLKSTRVEPVNILKKLRASQLFFDYLLSICEFEKQWDETIAASYQAHYVVVHDGAKKENKSRSLINKNPTNAKNTNCYTHEHKTLKLAVVPVNVLNGGKARVSFNKIALLLNH